MMHISEILKNNLLSFTLSLLNFLRTRIQQIREYFLILQQFGDNSLWKNLVRALQAKIWPRKTILFFPEYPPMKSVELKLCAMLGYAITTNPKRKFDVAFKREDLTFFNQTILDEIPISRDKIINACSIDISKNAVGKAFTNTFGYTLEIDPTKYHGRIVEKSNINFTHDGQIIQGPIAYEEVRSEKVYQKEINNTIDKDGLELDSMILDYRVPIHGNQIPFVYLKYRPIERRFSNENTLVILEETSDVFSPVEIDNLIRFGRRMGIDYGEIDVLRDKDGRIYVVDVNNTPSGPPNGLPKLESNIALKRLMKSFSLLIENWQS